MTKISNNLSILKGYSLPHCGAYAISKAPSQTLGSARRVCDLLFGICDLFVIWNLYFGIS